MVTELETQVKATAKKLRDAMLKRQEAVEYLLLPTNSQTEVEDVVTQRPRVD